MVILFGEHDSETVAVARDNTWFGAGDPACLCKTYGSEPRLNVIATRSMNDDDSSQPFDAATAWVNPPGMGRALVTGVAIGVAVSFVGVGGAFLAGGQGWAASIGMGAFVAFWGGLGFGGMIGGVVWATGVEEAAKQDRLDARAAADVAAGAAGAAGSPPSDVSAIGEVGGRTDASPEAVPLKAAS